MSFQALSPHRLQKKTLKNLQKAAALWGCLRTEQLKFIPTYSQQGLQDSWTDLRFSCHIQVHFATEFIPKIIFCGSFSLYKDPSPSIYKLEAAIIRFESGKGMN